MVNIRCPVTTFHSMQIREKSFSSRTIFFLSRSFEELNELWLLSYIFLSVWKWKRVTLASKKSYGRTHKPQLILHGIKLIFRSALAHAINEKSTVVNETTYKSGKQNCRTASNSSILNARSVKNKDENSSNAFSMHFVFKFIYIFISFVCVSVRSNEMNFMFGCVVFDFMCIFLLLRSSLSFHCVM